MHIRFIHHSVCCLSVQINLSVILKQYVSTTDTTDSAANGYQKLLWRGRGSSSKEEACTCQTSSHNICHCHRETKTGTVEGKCVSGLGYHK